MKVVWVCPPGHSEASTASTSSPGPSAVRSEALEQHRAVGCGERRTSFMYDPLEEVDEAPLPEELFMRPEVEYIHVRDMKAGCYDFRVERA